jgi:hypothetical protein
MDNYIRAAGTFTVLAGLATASCSSSSGVTPDRSRLSLSQGKGPEEPSEPAPDGVVKMPAPSALLSCDIRPELGGNSEEHICVGTSGFDGDSSDVSRAASECTALGGVVGRSCDPTGVVAGCRGSTASAHASITYTYWYYSGTVEHVKESCTNPMQVVYSDTEATDSREASQASTGLTLL